MYKMSCKKIHYCWFGGAPFPEIVIKCMESWKKFCPDYKIVEWNESNFNIHCCKYVEEAYNAKKWAFVSDYCRFFVLYNYGGVYLDTDVELIKTIDDLPENFVGLEDKETCNSGLIRGAQKGDMICEKMLKSYNDDAFILEDGSLNLKTVCERETDILKLYGLKGNGCMQNVCGTTVFPKDYFSPKDYVTQKVHITERTYSIHHYAYSWQGEKENISSKIYRCLYKIFGAKFANKVRDIFGKKK